MEKNGTALASTSSTLTIANVAPTDAGTYTVLATGACSSATNSAVLILANSSASTPLTNVIACPNQTAVFAAANSTSATYSWRKNGISIPGSTVSSLTIQVATAQMTMAPIPSKSVAIAPP